MPLRGKDNSQKGNTRNRKTKVPKENPDTEQNNKKRICIPFEAESRTIQKV